MKYSNQRITKLKKDYIEELLKRAESVSVEDACSIQQPGSDLTPYPDLDNLRLWSREYLLKGINKIYPVSFTDDGQTYLTTIVDGLVLFTKLTKSIGDVSYIPNPDEPEFVQPTDFKQVTTIDTTSNCVISNNLNTGATMANCLNSWQLSDGGVWHSASGKNQTIIIYFKDAIKPTSINFENRRDDPGSVQPISQVTVSASNDNSNYVQIGYTTNDNQSVGGAWSVNCNTDTRYHYFKLECIGAGPYCALSKCIFNVKSDYIPSYSTFETSKPGLWLSNLVQPVSDSLAGSWLRHNLIHDNLSLYTSLNADTIGNYTFSFYQRGIIHRDKGSTHDNNDSYCQHWSPSALGCISHDAIIIPENNLRSTYTSYQMPVTPVNPDMQSYDETTSKDVAFTFVDNTNDIPLTTTTFNGRVVGDGWTYELLFKPNGNGSGNGYGTGSNPSADNGSNGGCVTGTIVYQDSNLGTTCTQEVNSCFQTNQSYFNSQVPNIPTNKPIDDNMEIITINLSSLAGSWRGDKFAPVGTYHATVSTLNCTSGSEDWIMRDSSGVSHTTNTLSNFFYEYNTSGGNCGSYIKTLSGGCVTPGGYCTCYTACYVGQAILRLTKSLEEEKNIDLYLNITDLKKQYESEGIPYPGGCGTTRFEIDISTTKCEKKYCKSILIAKNVDINSLGDISKLEEQVLSNSK